MEVSADAPPGNIILTAENTIANRKCLDLWKATFTPFQRGLENTH
jgi:hypothetical protein